MEFISSFFSTPLWHFFDNPLCKNQKIRFIRSTRENIKKRHRNIEKKIRSLASGNVLTQGFFSPERKGKKNSAVSRKRRKRKFLQVSLLKKCKVGVRRDRTYKLCILSGKLDRLKSHILPPMFSFSFVTGNELRNSSIRNILSNLLLTKLKCHIIHIIIF